MRTSNKDWRNRVSSGSVFLLIPAFLFAGCFKSEYTRLVERELSRNVRYDSLFFGLKFGTTRKEFYEQCWALNREHILTMGMKNSNVLYSMKDSTGIIQMHFYPEFIDNKIVQVPVIFSYENWAPWNRQTQSDSLQLRIKKLLDNWYGTGFIRVEREGLGDFAFVKVDGNRRITIFRDGEMEVKVLFTDLLSESQIKKEKR